MKLASLFSSFVLVLFVLASFNVPTLAFNGNNVGSIASRSINGKPHKSQRRIGPTIHRNRIHHNPQHTKLEVFGLLDIDPSAYDLLLPPPPNVPTAVAPTIVLAMADVPGIVQRSDTWVFVAGMVPFVWASIEFWRRIAFGEAFGTGSDQVVIGQDDSPSDSRGRRVLGKGALIVAYVLFAISFATIGIVLYSIASSSPPPEVI